MEQSRRNPLNTQIYSEASDWLVEFRSGDVDAVGRQQFYAWLRTSPEHMRAYVELAAIWNEGAQLDPGRQFDDEALMRDVHLEGNVFSLPTQSARASDANSARAAGRSPRWGRLVNLALSLAASVMIATAGLGAWFYLQRDVYATEVGEQRTLSLSDGSRIELNARSRVRIRYSDAERSIELLKGQAFFNVAKDESRPFVVTSDDNFRVRAVGTQFDVYRKASGTTVTVVEGRVALLGPSAVNPAAGLSDASMSDVSIPATPPDTPEVSSTQPESAPRDAAGEADGVARPLGLRKDEMLLGAGEQAIVTAQATIKQAEPDISAATAWTQGQLIFRGAPLQQVADEFNRYNARRLVIRDPELADFNVTGVFSSSDPAPLIRFLETRPNITVTRTADEILISRK